MNELEGKIVGKLRNPKVAALATVTEDGKPWVRYVAPRGEEDLTVRFATDLDSRKVAQICKNPEVHLTCGVSSTGADESYVQVQGIADVVTDPEARTQFWQPEMQKYFTGPEDPRYALVRIRPYRIEYLTADSDVPEVWEAG